MRKLISFKTAANACLIIYGILLLYHLIIIVCAGIFDFIPTNIVWGGNIETKGMLIVFESLSFVIMTLFLFLTLIKAKYINIRKLNKVAYYAMWVLFVFFLLNTIGNITAKTLFEKSFAILTIMLSLFSLRLALEKEIKLD